MAEKISRDTFTALSETLLLPLWAKAVEYDRPQPLLTDAEAKRMMGEIDYDFAKLNGVTLSQVGTCARASLIDGHVREFLAKHPQAVVVQLGAGLDARYERLGRPQVAAWYDLDLPEVMALRSRLLPAADNIYLAQSMFEEGWTAQVAAHGLPVCIVAEGVLMYFEETRVRQLFAMLTRAFAHAWLVFDALPPLFLGKAKRHDALRHLQDRPELLWALADPYSLQNWQSGLRIRSVRYLSSAAGKRFPLPMRLLCRTGWGRRNIDFRVVCAEWNLENADT